MNAFLFRRVFLIVFLLVVAGWSAGFLVFVNAVSSYQEPLSPDSFEQADAAVVLTGGSERLMTGLRILQAGKVKKLFVSGVYPSVKLSTIEGYKDVGPDVQQCCIQLGHEAGNTAGNADEVEAYMRREGFASMTLVTANYHMPRSLLLFSQRMPDIKLVPYPVVPETVDLRTWWRKTGTASLLAFEYCKYLYAWVRLGGVV